MNGVLTNIKTLATCPVNDAQDDLGIIANAAIVWENDTIRWVGPATEIPNDYTDYTKIDAENQLVVPGLIDCHTHLAFGGSREKEFEQRILGAKYQEILESGGGIQSTVNATRNASEEELLKHCLYYTEQMKSLGITTLECKSGYGLTQEDELKLLRVYKKLAATQPLEVIATFLGAHIIPKEYKDHRVGYVKLIVEEMLPKIPEENLAQFCDVFVEKGAFTVDEAQQILSEAKAHGLQAKLHVDQLNDGDGAQLAATVDAVSADHLEFANEAGLQAMSQCGSVAVNLPLASLYTFQKPLNARKLIKMNIPVAVATDFNPGTAPSYHLPMVMMLACTLTRMTPREVLKGVTAFAAKALCLEASHGSITPGKKADFAVLNITSIEHWMYQFSANACTMTIKNGEVIYQA